MDTLTSSRLLSLSADSDQEDDEARLRRLLAEVHSDDDEDEGGDSGGIDDNERVGEVLGVVAQGGEDGGDMALLAKDKDLEDETLAALMDILGSPSNAENADNAENAGNTDAVDKHGLLEWADEPEGSATATKKVSKLSAVKDDPGLAFQVQQEETEESSEDFSFVTGTYEIGGEAVEVPNSAVAAVFLVRPDIAWDTIFGCVEVVLLSQGGRVQGVSEDASEAELQKRKLEVLASNPSQGWKAIRVYTGANMRKQRAVLVVIESNFDPSATLLRAFGSTSRPPNSNLIQIMEVMRRALSDQKYTLSHLNECNYAALDTVVDVQFIQDVQRAFAYEMVQNLRALAASLDAHLNDLERRCARMMTALKPVFVSACLEMPDPPALRPLDKYPLDIQMQTIMKATPEAARWILLKARREASQHHLKALEEGKSSSQSKTEHAYKVETLLKAIYSELHSWCDMEAKARVKRKTMHVADRITDITTFRAQLILALNARMVSSAQDVHLHREFHAMFRVAQNNEPIILDVVATSDGRRGRLFVTFSHIYYDAPGNAFLAPVQKVLPLYTIFSVAKGFPTSVAGGLSSLLGQQALVIRDLGNTEHVFFVHGNAIDFLDRVLDVVSQVLYLYREARERSLQRADLDLLLITGGAAPNTATPKAASAEASDDWSPDTVNVQAPEPSSYVLDRSRIVDKLRSVALKAISGFVGEEKATTTERTPLAQSIRSFLTDMQHTST